MASAELVDETLVGDGSETAINDPGPSPACFWIRSDKLDPHNPDPRFSDLVPQLYNLDADPGETNNLYFEHPEIVKELKSQLEQYKESGRSAPLRN